MRGGVSYYAEQGEILRRQMPDGRLQDTEPLEPEAQETTGDEEKRKIEYRQLHADVAEDVQIRPIRRTGMDVQLHRGRRAYARLSVQCL